MDISGDEFEPTAEEVAAEAAHAPLLCVNADRWDRFLSWVSVTSSNLGRTGQTIRMSIGVRVHCSIATMREQFSVISMT